MKTTPLQRIANVAFATLLFLLMSVASAADIAQQSDVPPALSLDRVALTGHVLPVLAAAIVDTAKSTATRGDEPLTLTVVLSRSDPDGLRRTSRRCMTRHRRHSGSFFRNLK